MGITVGSGLGCKFFLQEDDPMLTYREDDWNHSRESRSRPIEPDRESEGASAGSRWLEDCDYREVQEYGVFGMPRWTDNYLEDRVDFADEQAARKQRVHQEDSTVPGCDGFARPVDDESHSEVRDEILPAQEVAEEAMNDLCARRHQIGESMAHYVEDMLDLFEE